jgi:hypothetical protein
MTDYVQGARIIFFAVALVFGSRSVAMAGSRARAIVLVMEGAPRSDRVRAALQEALADRYTVLPEAREREADAMVVVRLPAPNALRTAHVVVVDARTSSASTNVDVALAPRPNAAVDVARIRAAIDESLNARSDVVETLSVETETLAPPEALELPRATGAAPERESLPSRPPRDVTKALVTIEPRIGIGSRHFDYRDRVTSGLRPYDLAAAPRVGIAGEIYPLVALTDGIWSGLGLSGECATALGFDSTRTDGGSVDTSWTSFDVALRFRLPLGERDVIAPHAGYGGTSFVFSPDPSSIGAAADASSPAVSYRFVRTGVDGRVAFWRLAALAALDALFVTGNAPLDVRFPHERVGGLEARLGVAFPFAPHTEARTGLAYQRFFYDFRPVRGDANVAGGALDQLTRLDVSLAVSY